jgi:lysophospholipase L1-like esterase
MATTARLDLTVWRNDDVFEYPLRVRGPDLSGADLRMQARLQGDTPGAPALDLLKVTNGNAEGIRVAGVTTVDGVKVNDVRIRINKSTLQNPAKFPYAGEIGEASWLEYALLIAGRTRLVGKIFAPPHAYGSDNAPTERQISYGSSSATAMPSGGATLTIANEDVAELVIDGADILDGLAAQSTSSAVRAEAALAATTTLQQGVAATVAGVSGFVAGSINATAIVDPSRASLTGVGAGGGFTRFDVVTFGGAGVTGPGQVDQFTVYCEQAIPGGKFKIARLEADGTYSFVGEVTKDFPAGEKTYTAPADFTAIPITPNCVMGVYQPTAGLSFATLAGTADGVSLSFPGDFTGSHVAATGRAPQQFQFKCRVQFDGRTEEVGKLRAIVGEPIVRTVGHSIVNGPVNTASRAQWLLPVTDNGYLFALNAYVGQAGKFYAAAYDASGKVIYLQDFVATTTGPTRFVLPKLIAIQAGGFAGLGNGTGKMAYTDGVGSDVKTSEDGRPIFGSKPARTSVGVTISFNYEMVANPATPLAQATGTAAADADSALVNADAIQAWKSRVEGALSRGERAIVAIVGDSQYSFEYGKANIPFTLRMRRKYGDGGPGWVSPFGAALKVDTGFYTKGETVVDMTGGGWSASAPLPTPDSANQQGYTNSTAGSSVYLDYSGKATITTFEYHHAGGGGTLSGTFNDDAGTAFQIVLPSAPGKIALPTPPAGTFRFRATIVSGTATFCGFNAMAASGLVVHNLSVGGTSARQWAGQDQTRWKAALANLGPHAFVLSAGGNDEGEGRSTVQFVADETTLIGTFRSIDPSIDVVVSIRAQTPKGGGITLRMADYAAAMRKNAASLRVAMFDAAKRFGTDPTQYSFSPTGSKFVALQSDNVHFNQLGRDIFVSGPCELLGA